MTVSVFAPASIGNVSVGFDVLGMAVKPVDGSLLGDVVTVSSAFENKLEVQGNFAKKLPGDVKDNIVWHCLNLYNQEREVAGLSCEPVKLVLEKKMPVGSGLGSSACSVVAALHALNEFYVSQGQEGFDKEKMLTLMGQMEAQISGSLHYDNVAPCYYGGLQLMVADPKIITRTLPFFDDCYVVMAYPGIAVSTKAAREALPDSYSRQDLIKASQNLATFVDACHRQEKSQAYEVILDHVAEPYREALIPGFSEAKQFLMENGALACGISGSGPTLFCMVDDLAKANDFAKWLNQHYLRANEHGEHEGFVHVCQADEAGSSAQ